MRGDDKSSRMLRVHGCLAIGCVFHVLRHVGERHQRKFAHSDAWMMRGREEAVAHVNSALV